MTRATPQVNFLALDFDLTIVDIHTSGRWPGTPEQLVQRIRPFFQSLIPAAAAQGKFAPKSAALQEGHGSVRASGIRSVARCKRLLWFFSLFGNICPHVCKPRVKTARLGGAFPICPAHATILFASPSLTLCRCPSRSPTKRVLSTAPLKTSTLTILCVSRDVSWSGDLFPASIDDQQGAQGGVPRCCRPGDLVNRSRVRERGAPHMSHVYRAFV